MAQSVAQERQPYCTREKHLWFTPYSITTSHHPPQRKLKGILHSYSFYIRIYTINSRWAYTGSGHLIYRVVVVWGSLDNIINKAPLALLDACLVYSYEITM